MAFTDHSSLFGSVHEDGINLIIRHIMRQRPSLFNYATPVFHERPELFCEKISVAETVTDAGNPIFTEQEPLPILGTPVPIGVNFCVQLTNFEIDFHPNNTLDLPEEISMPAQHFAVRGQACVGLDCPSDDLIDELVPLMERIVVAQQIKDSAIETNDEQKARLSAGGGTTPSSGNILVTRAVPQNTLDVFAPISTNRLAPSRQMIVLPTRELLCFCLEVFVAGHFEWGMVAGSEQQWLKPRVDKIEIVDIAPTPMENAIECYVRTMLRLGILPRLMVPMEKMILDISAMLQEQGLDVGQQINLQPALVPQEVPNNPALEDDQIKAFINLSITEEGE
jgi:hypothetical protein